MDLSELSKLGYGPTLLGELGAQRTTLQGESGERRRRRGAKKGSRMTEASALRSGKRLLRSGATLAVTALSTRAKPADETAEVTRTVVDSIMKQIDALSGRIGSDTATLRTRLQTLRSLLNAPELSPSAEAATAITGTVTQIDEVLAVLPSLTEAKKGLQQAALEDTAALDEVDGRAYWNLKLLTQCGRARFNELGDDARAAPYHLLALHPSKAKPPVAPPP